MSLIYLDNNLCTKFQVNNVSNVTSYVKCALTFDYCHVDINIL